MSSNSGRAYHIHFRTNTLGKDIEPTYPLLNYEVTSITVVFQRLLL